MTVPAESPPAAEADAGRPSGIPRLVFRIPRLRAEVRFTYAFHAREVRFERDLGSGFEPVFPETFSFHADRHDPAELYLRFEDLWASPERLAPGATRRDAEELVVRLLAALPAHLAGVLDRLDVADSRAPLLRASEDVAVFVQVVERFVADKGLGERPRLRTPALHQRKLLLRALDVVVAERVRPDALARYERGELDPVRSSDPHDTAFFHVLAEGDPDEIDAALVGAAERAYFRWLEGVCLDNGDGAFDTEGSPFEDREAEVLAAVARDGRGPASRAGELSPFLCRRGSRDTLRLLEKLETWFLRQYDVHHAGVVIAHAARLARGEMDPDHVLSRHSTRAYVLALVAGAVPFLLAVPFYGRAPRLFDWLVSIEVALVLALAFWFLVYRFMWRKDLTFFHTSVPRIGAGIIVGYLPVFVIDEVWDLAEQSPFYLGVVAFLLGSVTLLYLYVEVQRRLDDPQVAFRRATDIFLLGILEAAGFGFVVTTLLGPLMAVRNWGPATGVDSLASLRVGLEPFLGELPRVLGVAPVTAFPTAVFLMTFMSFFIGTFLQLLWEDLPITEPL